MIFANKYYTNYLQKSFVILDNLQKNTVVKERLSDYGYNQDRFDQGTQLRTAANDLFHSHLETRQERKALRENLRKTYREVYNEYHHSVKILRAQLWDDPETRAQLGLDIRKERIMAGLVEQATSFYNTGLNNADILEKIQVFGFDTEKLQAGLSGVQEFRTLRSRYDKVSGECQKLIVERDRAFKRLRGWVSAVINTCEVVFEDNPQALEELGIFVRNRPRLKKKEENTGEKPPAEGENGPREPAKPLKAAKAKNNG